MSASNSSGHFTRNTEIRWGVVSKSFHWIIFLLIVAAWATFELHDGAPKDSPERIAWLNYHKAFGLTVFFLIWFRLGWRLSNVVPKTLVVSVWQNRAATAVHWLLYFLMIAMPATGILMSEYGEKPISWFGLFTLPQLVTKDKDVGRFFHGLHTDIFWTALLILVGLHVVAALWHHFFVKDATLKRMLPGGGE